MADRSYPTEHTSTAPTKKYPDQPSENAEIVYPSPADVPAIPDVKLRPHLVDSGVNFLLHRDMQHSSLKSKKTFLLRKGLTNEEIDEAIHQAQLSFQIDSTQQSEESDSSSQLGRWSALIVLFGAASIGLYRLYQSYILPFLLGEDKKQTDITSQNVISHNQQITELTEKVTVLQTQTEQYKTAISDLVHEESRKYSNQVKEVHDEIKSVKKLLLNRSQFPATPVQKPVIPSWQLQTETKPSPQQANGSSEQPAVVNGTEPPINDTTTTTITPSLPSLNTNGSHDVTETNQSNSDTDTSVAEKEKADTDTFENVDEVGL